MPVTFLRLVSSIIQEALLIIENGAWIKPHTYEKTWNNKEWGSFII